MRPVNLIPPEDRRGDHAPLRAGVASYAVIAVLAVALIGAVLVVLAGNDISESKAEIAALEARQVQADARAAELAPYGEFASLEQARADTVSSLAQSRFDWERVLNELALVLPERVTLETLTGTVGSSVSVSSEGGASGVTADPSIAGPSLQLAGCAHGQKGVARLLASLRDIDGVTRVGMQSSELPTGDVTGAAAAPTSDDTGGATGDCQTGPEIARFQATVAFDAVPVPETATPPGTTPPAPTTPATTPAPATDDGGVAATQTEQQGVEDSAADQSSQANGVADAVGVGN
ncbi:MAG TPA: hypothetical protein VD765_00720 [Solirubrobacterales bacterium]|nr:hypothetical protein [Solirubrobacterales bacterium]